MSTPSGKPFSAFVPEGARERAAAERHPVDDDDPLRSPYAPKRRAARPFREPNRAESDAAGQLRFPYARNSAGSIEEQPSVQPDDCDDPPKTAHEQAAAEEYPVEQGEGPDLRSAQAANNEHGADERRADEMAGDADRQRLEAALSWLHQERSVDRLPRVTQLPPVPGLRSDAKVRRHSDEMFINGVRVPPSLEPERLLPPALARARRDNLRWPWRILIACVIAAPIAYYLVANWASTPQPASGAKLASADSQIVALPATRIRQSFEAKNDDPRNDDPRPLTQSETFSQRATPPQGETVATLQASSSDAQAKPTSTAARKLDPADVNLLVKQGEQFVAAGDLVTARLVFQRAAEAGDATAAMALRATYDPVVLARLGVRGISADVDKARSWYQKAMALGAPEASRRLELLANR